MADSIKQLVNETLKSLHVDPTIPKHVKEAFTAIDPDSLAADFMELCEVEEVGRAFLTFAIGTMLNAYIAGMSKGLEVKPLVISPERPLPKNETQDD